MDFQSQVHVFGGRIRSERCARRQLAINSVEDDRNSIRRLIRDGNIQQPIAGKIAFCRGHRAIPGWNAQRRRKRRIAEPEKDVESVGRFAYHNQVGKCAGSEIPGKQSCRTRIGRKAGRSAEYAGAVAQKNG